MASKSPTPFAVVTALVQALLNRMTGQSDLALGTLVTQGTLEGVAPAVSPNTGRLFTVGSLGLGPLLDVAFDIADTNNKALAVVRTARDPRSRLYELNLVNGQAKPVGTVANGAPLLGMAIEP